jgi:hypothetical protein
LLYALKEEGAEGGVVREEGELRGRRRRRKETTGNSEDVDQLNSVSVGTN